MESQPLLRPEQDARAWVCVRRGLLLLFWILLAALLSSAIAILARAYVPPPPSAWHQRRVICRIAGLAPRTDVTHRIREASSLGCGGLILAHEEVTNGSVRDQVTEGQRYGLRIILEVHILEEYDGHQVQRLKDSARSWMEDGASGFQLLGDKKASVMMISQILLNEVEITSGEERLILLPNWLCNDEDAPKNKSQLLRTCPLPDWNLQPFTMGSDMKDMAWEVTPDDIESLELRQFLAVTLPGTVILSLNQSLPPPSWLRSLLHLRYQNPALHSGWLQRLSNGSSYSALSSWACSTLLVLIGPSDRSHNVSLHFPYFSNSVRLLLTTKPERNRGQLLQDRVLLAPGEAQLIRLIPE
ncbi:uncharacterized protein LOC143806235 isoform X1 [Ranitomeya variabilis]|uniref:uncharacterized protein LOC143806235 isoform X1 n=1 Tax=Ranitomeya variabilis TaxID=490064 RepID=UPI004057343E